MQLAIHTYLCILQWKGREAEGKGMGSAMVSFWHTTNPREKRQLPAANAFVGFPGK